jgi:hypothetical protein
MAIPDGEPTGAARDLSARWVLANVIGFAAGGAIAGALARAMGQPSYGVPRSTVDAVLIATRTAGAALAVWGAAIGTAQWLVIRGEMRRAGWWIPGTCAGWTLAGMVAGILSGLLGGAVTGIGRDVGVWGFVVVAAVGILALGFLPVTFQWMMLRQQVHDSRRWLLGAAGAFVIAAFLAAGVVRWGMVDLFAVLRPEDFPSAKAWAAFGMVLGLLYGVMTGDLLGRLLRGSSRGSSNPET